jgi:hypothetical protein
MYMEEFINFEKMKLSEDKRSVFIAGKSFGYSVTIKMSIIQLAKIFGTDRELSGLDYDGLVSGELEDNCKETREFVQKYPEIQVWDSFILFDSISVKEVENNIQIFAEDISGWDNEGIYITIPKEIFEKIVNSKILELFVDPFGIKIIF